MIVFKNLSKANYNLQSIFSLNKVLSPLAKSSFSKFKKVIPYIYNLQEPYAVLKSLFLNYFLSCYIWGTVEKENDGR